MFFRKRDRIIELEKENADLMNLRDKLIKERDDYKKRLRRAGNADYVYFESNAVKAYKVDVKGIPFGGYVSLVGESDNEIINAAKEQVTKQLVEALIDSEYIQFVIKRPEDFNPLDQFCTVGAKLRVVPWEQMTVMILHKKISE